MKTKIPHLILAGLFGTAIASQGAVVVTVSDADFDPNIGAFGTTDLGTFARDQNVVDGPGPQTFQHTVSGLTIDDDGTANDSVQITFTATASSTINSGVDNSNQGFFSVGSWLGAGQWTRMDFTEYHGKCIRWWFLRCRISRFHQFAGTVSWRWGDGE